ncbi:MAG: hypothetical protein U0840_07870 [Gemmataceae bacterium]
MKRISLAALLATMTLSLADVQAQVILFGGRRPPQGAPVVGMPNQGGLFGGNLFGGGLFGSGTYVPPSGPSPNAPGYQMSTGRSTISRQVSDDGIPQTGHAARFFYYSHYFMNQSGGAMGGGGGGSGISPYTTQAPEALVGLGGGTYARSQGGVAPPAPPRTPSRGGR